jgi:hypothetical protein
MGDVFWENLQIGIMLILLGVALYATGKEVGRRGR